MAEQSQPGPVDTGAQQADVAIEAAHAEATAKARADTKAAPSPPAAKADEAEPTKDAQDDGERAGDAGEQQSDDHGDVPEGVKKKLGKLTRRVYEEREAAARERARAEQLQAELEQLRKGASGDHAPPAPVTPPPVASDRPTLEAFGGDAEKYLEALSDWKYDQRIKADAAQRELREKQAAAQQQISTHKGREEQFATAHPDYYEKAYTAPVNYSPAMVEFITQSEQGPALAYYLSEHLDEAKVIEALPPMRQAIALDRIERSMTQAPAPSVDDDEPAAPERPARTVTKAPPPPATVAAAGTTRRDPSDPGLSTAERIAMWRRQKKR